MPPDPPPLCVADDATFWPWLRWPQFAAWPGKERALVVVPLAGLADWGLDAALDAEEQVLTAVLADASRQRRPEEPLLVLPPLRFVHGPAETCAFSLTSAETQSMIEEVVGSVAVAGFRRIVLLNASPWNEALVDAVARDLRVERGLQMFCVNLAALGLDFDPSRDPERRALQALLASLPGPSPELASASRHLAALLGEIHLRPALPNDGRIPPAVWP